MSDYETYARRKLSKLDGENIDLRSRVAAVRSYIEMRRQAHMTSLGYLGSEAVALQRVLALLDGKEG
jgi:hypothetical protein